MAKVTELTKELQQENEQIRSEAEELVAKVKKEE